MEPESFPDLTDRQRALIQDALEALEALQELARPGAPLASRKATCENMLKIMALLARGCMIETEVGRGPFHDESM